MAAKLWPDKISRVNEKAIPISGKQRGKLMTTISTCFVWPWLERNDVKAVNRANPKQTANNTIIQEKLNPVSYTHLTLPTSDLV